jgi:hypothetical protein
MLTTLLQTAARSPSRHRFVRTVAAAWLFLVGGLTLASAANPARVGPSAQLLLVGGIVAGATVIGWRLTQAPKGQSLEFLFVSPVRPSGLLLAEAAACVVQFTAVIASAAPLVAWWVWMGLVEPLDLIPLLFAPWLWGLVTGFGLTVWAYEPPGVRQVGEWLGALGILTYLIIGVFAGEKLLVWAAALPGGFRDALVATYVGFHRWNPFAVQQAWFESAVHPAVAFERMTLVSAAAAACVLAMVARAAWRLKGHFDDRHYRPLDSGRPADLAGIGDRPLAWWAVRRVMEYSGRLNLYLAAGFGLVYACFIIAGDSWPEWMGRGAFVIVERMGGVASLTTGLVILAAVPAAFQYGLWDSNTPDRLRRLELLLLTRLDGRDYWDAAVAAAWRRGRGYLAVAAVLWLAACWSGRAPLTALLFATAASVLVWGLYFVIGFRAYAGGNQSGGVASLLVLGAPLVTYLALQRGWVALAAFTPPGWVFLPLTGVSIMLASAPALTLGLFALRSSRTSIEACEDSLRRWYDANHGCRGAK